MACVSSGRLRMILRVEFEQPRRVTPHAIVGRDRRVPRLVCPGDHPRVWSSPLPHFDAVNAPLSLVRRIESANRDFEQVFTEHLHEMVRDDGELDPDAVEDLERRAALDPSRFRELTEDLSPWVRPTDSELVRPASRLGELVFSRPVPHAENWLFDGEPPSCSLVASGTIVAVLAEHGLLEDGSLVAARAMGSATDWHEINVLRYERVTTKTPSFACPLCGQQGFLDVIEPTEIRDTGGHALFRVWGSWSLFCSSEFRDLYVKSGWEGLAFVG